MSNRVIIARMYHVYRMYKLVLVSTVLIFLVSCTTSSPYNRGPLSEGMDKSRDDYEGEREVESEYDGEDAKSHSRDQDDSAGTAESGVVLTDEGFYLGARGGNSWYGAPYFDSLFDTELLLGTRENTTEFLLFGGIKAVEAKPESDIADSVDGGVVFFRGGLEVRYYPISQLRFFSPYILGQIGGLYMYWSFKNPISAGTDTIFNDAVGGLILATGAGIHLIDTEAFRLGCAVIPEVHLFTSETHQGFQNDVFDAYGTLRWAIEAGITM